MLFLTAEVNNQIYDQYQAGLYEYKQSTKVPDVNVPFKYLYFDPNFAFFLIPILHVVNQIILLTIL